MDYTYTNPQQQLQHQQQLLKEQQYSQQQGFQQYPSNDNISSTYLYQQPQQQAEATFHRSTEGFPRSVLDRATAAKLRLEHYYKTALDQAFERNQR